MTQDEIEEYRNCTVRVIKTFPELAICAGARGILLDYPAPHGLVWLRMFKRTNSMAGKQEKDVEGWVAGYVVALGADHVKPDVNYCFPLDTRVIRLDQGGDSDRYQAGRIVEESLAPWIEFDNPTRYPYGHNGGKNGYCDCVPIHSLALEEYGTIAIDSNVDYDSPTYQVVEPLK